MAASLRIASATLLGALWLGCLPLAALAHCDTLDGPVVTLARQALDSGNVNLVPAVGSARERR